MDFKTRIYFHILIIIVLLNLSFCAKRSKEEWKSRSIYQVLTDRFAKAGNDVSADCANIATGYCGGTFKGIQEKLDYIKGMGFDAIWISPPLKNKDGSYHGYHNIDIYSINEHFGTSAELKELIKECHKKDIWVILDAVPNHMSGDLPIETFIPFNKSEYYHEDCPTYNETSQNDIENCRIWGMPDLAQENEFVKETLLNWIKDIIKDYGFDGVRYADVPNVPKRFWKEFTKAADTYTLGIISGNNAAYIADYQRYMDGVGDYPLFYAIRESFCGSMKKLEEYHLNTHKLYINPSYNGIWLGNHDKPRFLSECNNKQLLRNAIIFILFYEGIPIFYYGDEQYFSGGGNDQNREVMFSNHDTTSDAYKMIKTANKVRKSQKIFEQSYIEVFVDDYLYAFRRGNVLVIVSNVEAIERTLTEHRFKEGDYLCDTLDKEDCIRVTNGELKIKLEGEPKLYVLFDDSKYFNKSNFMTLFLFLILILSF